MLVFFRRSCLAMFVLAAGLAFGTGVSAPARAAEADAALALLASESYADIEAGVTALAASGAETAPVVLEALGDNRLFYRPVDKAVFVKIRTDTVLDAKTGAETAGMPPGAKPVRINNRVRRALDAAQGSLALLSPDPGRRLAAANAVFKARDAGALPLIEAALARETEPRIQRALREAAAAVTLGRPEASDLVRLGALDVIAKRGDQDALALLRAQAAEGNPALKPAAEALVLRIEQRLALWAVAQNLVYGISLGSVLLLAAVGLAITFGQMGVINMAHGEMVMLGAYTTFMVQEVIRNHAPGLFEASLFIAIPLAFLVAGAVGVAIERGVIRFLYGRPLETLLATWGLSLILQQAVRTLFGPSNRDVGTPRWMSGTVELGGLTLTSNRIAIVLFSLAVFAALLLVLRRTSLGLKVRAVTQNRRMAAAMGINTARIDALTFGLGSGVAGMAGVALSQIDNVSPNLGQGYIIDSFMVVVFGGVGNLWGTLVGALSLGIVNKFLEPYAGAVLGKILLLVAIILFIQKRPRGLFALKGRAVEA